MRSGFTTGTCAAAASAAAAGFLLSGSRQERITLMTPAGREADMALLWPEAAKGRLALERLLGGQAFQPALEKRAAACGVIKDAGDDPDVTDKSLVAAVVWQGAFSDPAGHRKAYIERKEGITLFLSGGTGIGLVTKQGLRCPVGFPAINPVPREMIFSAVGQICRDRGFQGELCICISIPEGEELAKKTFNPRLGIEGGLSVLGTTGIVNPMSEAALIETIRLEIRVKSREGRRLLAVAPGNYGEAFLREQLGLSLDAFVKCSNFVGETFRLLCEEGIREVLFAGHVGKLIKVAGGVMNTHSKYGDRRMELLWSCTETVMERLGLGEEEIRQAGSRILAMNTTDEACLYLEELGLQVQALSLAAERIQAVLEERFPLSVEVIVFSGTGGGLGMTKRAALFAERRIVRRGVTDDLFCRGRIRGG